MSGPVAPPAGAPVRILVAEDEPAIRQYVLDILARAQGIEVVAVPSGEEALRALDEQWFDVVVSDQRMGLVDGLAVLEHARKAAPEAPRVMITGYPDLELAVVAKNRGHVDRFLPKPFSPAAFLGEITPLLDERRRTLLRKAAFERALGVR